VDLVVDGKQVDRSVTDAAGAYHLSASLPSNSSEGEHGLYTSFEPKQGIYASATSERIAIQLYYLRPTFSQLSLAGVAPISGQLIAFSGQTVRIEGRLEIDSKPFGQGLVMAFLGDRELGRTLSKFDGVFRMSIIVPLDVSNENTIEIVFVPPKLWYVRSAVSRVLWVLNSVVTGSAIGATMFALLVFSGRSIDTVSILRRRVVPRRRPETKVIPFVKPEVMEGVVPAMLSLSDFKLELQLGLKLEEPRAFVKATYWEIRHMVADVLGAKGEPSETPREYEARVADKLGAVSSSLSALTELFEVAKYSQHTIARLEAQEGINHAFRIAEEMNARMKS
jgi:hypothetical protein